MASSDAPRTASDSIPVARAGGIVIVAVSFAIVLSNFGGFLRLGASLVPLTAALSFLPVAGTLIAGAVSMSASATATGAAFIGRPVSAADALLAGFGRIGTVVWVSLSTGVIVMLLGLTIIGIPFAMHLLIRWSLVIPVVTLEGVDSRKGRSRSTELVRGQWWRVMGITVLMNLTVSVLLVAAAWAGWIIIRAYGFPIGALPLVIAAPLFLVFAYVGSVFTTLLYIDARARREGFSETQLRAAVTARA